MRSQMLPDDFAYPTDPGALREDRLRARYRRQPGSAWRTHIAWTEASGAPLADGLRGQVQLGLAGSPIDFSIDESLGGPHDAPTPAEMLCASLTACIDSGIRLAAARMRIGLERLVVITTGDVDALGALGEPDVAVGVQSMRIEVQLELAGHGRGALDRLMDAAERRSVLLQTLRKAMPIDVVVVNLG